LRLALLLVLLSVPAFACNQTSEGDCTNFSAITGSFATMANSAWGSAPKGVEAKLYTYNASLSLTAYEFRPVGLSSYTNVPVVVCIHGGGWSSGDATGCMGGSTTVARPVEGVQNFSGPVILYLINYRLTGTAIWPVQWQDPKCWLYEFIANAHDGNPNDIRLFGFSAGGHMALWLGTSSNSAFANSCPSPVSAAYTITGIATLSAPTDLAGAQSIAPGFTAAQSLYENTCLAVCASTGIVAINDLLNCSSNATCASQDVALRASNIGQIAVSNPPVMFAGGLACTVCDGTDGDNLVQWRANQALSIRAYAALSPAVVPAQWIGPSSCYTNYLTWNCKHGSDFQDNGHANQGFNGQALPAIWRWLGNVTGGSGLPVISAAGTVNAASYATPVAAGSIAGVFGSHLALGQTSSMVASPLPTTLGQTSFGIGGTAAPLFFATADQVNLQIPWEMAGRSQAPVVATVNGETSNTQMAPLAAFAPGIFTIDAAGAGQGAVLIAPTAQLAAPGTPVSRGDYVSIYCTGLGTVTNQPATGVAATSSPLSRTLTLPSVTIGGIEAVVTYSGLAPTFAGVYQVNAVVPTDVSPGNAVPVVISMGSTTSNTVTIAVQ